MKKYSEKITQNENGEPVFEIYENGETKTLTPLEKGLFREKEFVILFQRIALNPKTLQNIEGWFVQKILYKIPNRDNFDYHWFFWEKRVTLPHIRILDARMGRLCGLTFAVAPMDKKFVKKTSAPKRITTAQAQKILKDKIFDGIPCLGVFSESGEEYVAPKSN